MMRRALGILVLGAGFLARVGVGHATTITVNDTQPADVDNQKCGLREALQAITTRTPTLPQNGVDCPAGDGNNDRIVLPAGVFADDGILEAGNPVEISGAGIGVTTIQAGGQIGLHITTSGTVTVRDLSYVRHPTQNLDVRGILVAPGTTLIMRNVRVADFNNYAIMDFEPTATVDLGGCVFENNGGSVHVEGALFVSQCSFVGNHSGFNSGGSGIEFFGMTGEIDSSTFSGNQSPDFGGGLVVGTLSGDGLGQRLDVLNSTFASNSAAVAGGGIYEALADSADPLFLNGVVIANNTAPNGPDVDSGGNLIADYTFCRNPSNFFGLFSNVVTNVDPKLGALVEITTPVRAKFHPLLAGSPVIDFVSGNPGVTDQRGFARPWDGNGDGTAQSDPGAFEYDPAWQSEKLLVAAKSSGDTHAIIVDSAYVGGQGTRFEANQLGDFVVYAIPVARTGSHTIKAHVRKGTNRGIYQVGVSTSPTGPWTTVGQADLFNGSLVFADVTFGTATFSTTGTKYFRFLQNGINGMSIGRWLYLDSITTSD